MRVACDSSILIPALNSLHPDHESAGEAWPQLTSVPAHVLLETYSVLTRLPQPYQLGAGDVARALRGVALEVVGLPESLQAELVFTCADAGVDGGAVYDALVAATARHHDLTLLTRDRRAAATYDAVGVRYAFR